ncbi:hypothetical protein NIES2100_21280 [Calothrix sp. NIES-2100]|uniref:hypothetical protein n=1 Tax=Calothrix sp. NIES-2100 TaxID=1954172 RepID=UPI000B601F78|nr:hypothetical protein NIES2100_21280 [Calothrix sp. NIES-2100]
MVKPSLTDLFGANAAQSSTSVTISKTDLAVTGLTASGSNTGEELLVALLKMWQSTATTTRQDSNPEQQVTIEDSYQQIVTRNNTQYRQFSKTVNLQIEDTTSTIDPDDF